MRSKCLLVWTIVLLLCFFCKGFISLLGPFKVFLFVSKNGFEMFYLKTNTIYIVTRRVRAYKCSYLQWQELAPLTSAFTAKCVCVFQCFIYKAAVLRKIEQRISFRRVTVPTFKLICIQSWGILLYTIDGFSVPQEQARIFGSVYFIETPQQRCYGPKTLYY